MFNMKINDIIYLLVESEFYDEYAHRNPSAYHKRPLLANIKSGLNTLYIESQKPFSSKSLYEFFQHLQLISLDISRTIFPYKSSQFIVSDYTEKFTGYAAHSLVNMKKSPTLGSVSKFIATHVAYLSLIPAYIAIRAILSILDTAVYTAVLITTAMGTLTMPFIYLFSSFLNTEKNNSDKNHNNMISFSVTSNLALLVFFGFFNVITLGATILLHTAISVCLSAITLTRYAKQYTHITRTNQAVTELDKNYKNKDSEPAAPTQTNLNEFTRGTPILAGFNKNKKESLDNLIPNVTLNSNVTINKLNFG